MKRREVAGFVDAQLNGDFTVLFITVLQLNKKTTWQLNTFLLDDVFAGYK